MVEKLLKAAYNYYVLNSPIISDAEYDELYKKVRKWEEENIPNEEQRITSKLNLGYFEGKTQTKLTHPFSMLSVDNADEEDINKKLFHYFWVGNDYNYVVTPKLDGVALELVYVDKKLQAKITRGDGLKGGDVTKAPIKGIPEVLPYSNLSFIFPELKHLPDSKDITPTFRKNMVVIRGEVLSDTWEGKTHRNYVAGSLGLLDIDEIEDRNLYFVPYFLFPCSASYKKDLEILEEWGFTGISKWVGSSVPPYEDLFAEWSEKYPALDGLVQRANFATSNIVNPDKLPKTSNHYKFQYAWKPPQETKETVILDVNWTQSKNNVWTPVAIIEPVEINGTEITRVNLASLDYINEKDIAIGDIVRVQKAKEIIPEIVEVIERPDDRLYIGLTHCPKCNTVLTMDGIYLKCPNENCVVPQAVVHFCKVIGIKGLGEITISKVGISRPIQLYSLKEEDLTPHLGAKAFTVLEEIEKSKSQPLIKLLAALNPPNVKEATLATIFRHIRTLDDLEDIEKLMEIKGIGEKTATAFIEWFKNNRLLLDTFAQLGFDIRITSPVAKEYKKIIAVSGTLPISRKQFIKEMGEKGIEVKTSITKQCNLLVVGDKVGESKLEKAKKYNIPIISYKNFIADIEKIKNKT
jgi:DNA ligase (NAD+)